MSKTILYYYPYDDSHTIKILVQSPLKAYIFRKEDTDRINLNMDEHIQNYAIYFLFGKKDKKQEVYIGQSKKGVERILQHKQKKKFWKYCMVFVTDNSSFNSTVLDYIEYYFIHKIDKSQNYISINKVTPIKPNVKSWEISTFDNFIDNIEFILNIERVKFVEYEEEQEKIQIIQKTKAKNKIKNIKVKKENITNEINKTIFIDDRKYYFPRGKKYKATVFYENNKFILTKDSLIVGLRENLKYYKPHGIRLYNNQLNSINKMIEEKILEKIDDRYKLLFDLEFSSISTLGLYVTGKTVNGWELFQNINEIRESPNYVPNKKHKRDEINIYNHNQNKKYYYPVNKKYEVKVYYRDNKFILAKNSIIVGARETTKKYQKSYKNFYKNYMNNVNKWLFENKLEKIEDKYKLKVDLEFSSISTLTSYITGKPENGWTFFENIMELRN